MSDDFLKKDINSHLSNSFSWGNSFPAFEFLNKIEKDILGKKGIILTKIIIIIKFKKELIK